MLKMSLDPPMLTKVYITTRMGQMYIEVIIEAYISILFQDMHVF